MKLSVLFILFAFTTLAMAKDYKGAEYRTKVSYLYGRFEVNYKAPQREGVLASFFTFYDGGGGSSTWNEIDIEVLGRYYDDVQFNTITPGEQHHVRHQSVDFNPALGFNTYAFEWTPGYVAWFINGVEVARQTGSHIQSLNRSQKIMMNIWNPQYENWAGKFNPDALPAFAYYDWVKYYSYTPGSGSYGTDSNFTLQWTEDFDYFNTDRWAKATHTFTGNLCDFIPENALFRNGKLVLCLTDAVNTGYDDKKAPVLLYARAEKDRLLAEFSEELDSVSAQLTSNYILPGFTIQSAVLLSNRKTVELNVPGLNLTQPVNFLVLEAKDTWGNTMNSKAVSVNIPEQFQYPLRINTGGTTAYLDFFTDREFKPDTDFGYLDGTPVSYGSPEIYGTEDDPVYHTDRYGMAKYMVRLSPGNYDLQLWFTENYFGNTGQRVFDVLIEGNKVIEDLDLIAAAGFRYAWPVSINNVNVEDGILDIHFSAEVNNPLINGIVINKNTSGIDEVTPLEFRVGQNYPNPFNSATTIRFSMGAEEAAEFAVFNMLGEKVYNKELLRTSAGEQEIKIDASSLSSGVYIYMLKGKKHSAINKMILLK